ncbi:MAG: carboxypeptidase-like regulatory domain-containing protein, partial [Emticicia sp.]|uniref:carboxypeptidase-like regulatory domain-containing protein n=1 Tax=Emticicia sp. TaxID=1930953 RepID=UPI003BA6A974
MKKLLLNLIYLFVSVAASAQTFSISGLVKNQQNEGVPFATTMLYKLKDSMLVKAEICTENGSFKINGIKPDKYYFMVSSVGFQKYRSVNFDVIDRAIDFSSIIMNAENQLAEVKVKAQKPLVEVLADKTVFNV